MTVSDHPANYRRLVTGFRALRDEAPDQMAGFAALNRSAVAEGALSTCTKELMALAVGIAVRCDGCVTFHVRNAMRAGASRAEIAETVGVAVLMGGGPAAVYGVEAFEALAQFEAADAADGRPAR